MTNTIVRAGAAGLLSAMLLFASLLSVAAQGVAANDVARYLAGLAPAAKSPVAGWTSDPGWQLHARTFDRTWKDLEERQLSKVRTWAAEHVQSRSPAMLYMFSGPDFLYADAIYPHASIYVFTGLEPPGQLPQMTEGVRRVLPSALAGLRAALGTVLNYSFFITKDMQTQLAGSTLNGTTPVLLVFMARAGKTIHEVNLVALDKDGELVRREGAAARGTSAGVEIIFTEGGGEFQTLYYFQSDLSDGGVRGSGLLDFARQLGPCDSLVKSASYLMHSSGFSRVREFLMDQCNTMIQDNSGIPIHLIKPADWELRPYGRYLPPAEPFPSKYQPRLAELFRTGSPQRIDFGLGYRWRATESNVLLAVKRRPRSE